MQSRLIMSLQCITVNNYFYFTSIGQFLRWTRTAHTAYLTAVSFKGKNGFQCIILKVLTLDLWNHLWKIIVSISASYTSHIISIQTLFTMSWILHLFQVSIQWQAVSVMEKLPNFPLFNLWGENLFHICLKVKKRRNKTPVLLQRLVNILKVIVVKQHSLGRYVLPNQLLSSILKSKSII